MTLLPFAKIQLAVNSDEYQNISLLIH